MKRERERGSDVVREMEEGVYRELGLCMKGGKREH